MIEQQKAELSVFGKSFALPIKECKDHMWYGGPKYFYDTFHGDEIANTRKLKNPGYKHCHYRVDLIAVYDDGTEETILTAEEKEQII